MNKLLWKKLPIKNPCTKILIRKRGKIKKQYLK